MNLVERTIARRLLWDYYEDIMYNLVLFEEEEITFEELKTQLELLNEEYADKMLE